MSMPLGEGLPGPETNVSLLEAVDELAGSAQKYYDACGAYARRPTDENGLVTDDVAIEYASAADACLAAMAVGMTVQDFKVAALGFFMSQSTQRADRLNERLGTVTLEKRQQAPKITIHSDRPWDDEAVKQEYGLAVSGLLEAEIVVDTQAFIEAVDAGPAALKMERRDRLRANALRAGGVALVAAFSTVAGAWWMNRRHG